MILRSRIMDVCKQKPGNMISHLYGKLENCICSLHWREPYLNIYSDQNLVYLQRGVVWLVLFVPCTTPEVHLVSLLLSPCRASTSWSVHSLGLQQDQNGVEKCVPKVSILRVSSATMQ
ncbi:hypothetical protein VNO77_03263 [Canavalia gladiata]|uniref:Uncharacterized protein n=1 Tax=Canavalia gladiata TaxID=3824 RepID=A0AAN9MUF5_CANGL